MATTISGPRVVRAARGTQLTAQGWPQEAALRMLCNNLDPEVAERPDDLVVYGGNGRAARSWAAFDAIVRTLQPSEKRRDDDRAERQARRGLEDARARAARADRQLEPRPEVGGLERSSANSKRKASTMYGQMTAGSWIYIGTQGIVQGTYETFAELARQHFGGSLEGRVSSDGGRRRHGRRAAARDHDERRRSALRRRRRSRASRTPPRFALSRPSSPTRARRRCGSRTRAKRRARRFPIGYEGNAATEFPELYEPGFRPDAVTDQTSAHDLLNGYVPAGVTLEEAAALRTSAPDEYERRALESCGKHVEAMVRVSRCRRGRLRLRQQYSRASAARRLRARLRFPRLRAGVHPAAVLPRVRTVSFRRALGRSERYRALDREAARALPERRAACSAGSSSRRNASHSKACRRASAGSATAIARKPGLRFNELVRTGRDQSADRDRPRSSRYRQRRVAVSRDRGDEGRQRRDRRLADPQRAAQHCRRRALGQLPSWRRRRASATACTRAWSSSPTAPTTRKSGCSAC